MASLKTTMLPLALPLAALCALSPDAAEACSFPCLDIPYFDAIEPLNAVAIPIDGVLVLQGTGNLLGDPELIAGLELVVTRDGQAVAGAVEATVGVGVLVWRPTLPFEPGTHAVQASVSNPANEPCGPESVELDFEFVVVDAPSEPLVPLVLSHEPSVVIEPSDSLYDLLCCDGAYPAEDPCGFGISWSEGECEAYRATGYLQVDIKAELPYDQATLGQVLRTFRVGGEVLVSGLVDQATPRFEKPFCTHVELQNLGTGEIRKSELVCHGNGLEDQLGPKFLLEEAKAELAGKCEGPIYSCEVIIDGETRWDPGNCSGSGPDTTSDGEAGSESEGGDADGDPTTTGPGSDTTPTSGAEESAGDSQGGSEAGSEAGGQDDGLVDHGCGCDSGAGDPAALLGLLGLAGLVRRRRR